MKKLCPDCEKELIEINDAILDTGKILKKMYPKDVVEPNLNQTYHEYRFYCKHCKKEWLFNSRPDRREFLSITNNCNPQFIYSEKQKLLILNKSKYERDKKIKKEK